FFIESIQQSTIKANSTNRININHDLPKQHTIFYLDYLYHLSFDHNRRSHGGSAARHLLEFHQSN
ncbi:hypothetical protein RDWZM_004454, partial [Blomia tropicalis]